MHDWVLGQYFETLGIALKRGRFLSSQEQAGSEPVAVINETMARRFWPDRDAVGQRVAWGGPAEHGPWMRVVGVVADVKQGALNAETMPQTYSPWLQVADGTLGENVLGIFRGMKVSVRTAVTPLAVTSLVRDQIRALDPALPVTNVQTMQDVVDTSTGPQRFNAILLGSFALLALLLAALGVGGVLATSVSRRRQEIGVRLALGAQRGDVVRLVVRQGMVLAIAGLAIGLPVSFALTRLISSLLFEVTPRDPITFAAVTTLLIGVAAVACLPAGAPGDAHRTDRGAATGMRGERPSTCTGRAIVSVCVLRRFPPAGLATRGTSIELHRPPIAINSRSVRQYHVPPTSAGEASTCAFSSLTCSSLNVRPA